MPSNDSIKKTITVALGVCLVCSILVSTAAVSLHGIQQHNKKIDKLKNILVAGDLLDDRQDVQKIYNEKIDAIIINLETGNTVPESEYTDELNTLDFDIKTVVNNPKYSKRIPESQDIAGIKKMPKYMAVYLVKDEGEIQKIILPIYGKGLWSTMYGFMALDTDLRTVKGFTFYEHGETPGLGGEVDNPRWKQQWVGKQVFDDGWKLKIQVIKSKVDPTDPEAKYKVDGLSGSTLTTRGVDNLVKFWLGENGFGPYLAKLREEMNNG